MPPISVVQLFHQLNSHQPTGKLVNQDGEKGGCFRTCLNYDLTPSFISLFNCPLSRYTCTQTHTHTHLQCGRIVWGGTIDKGVLACGKGNHGAGAWVARVRLSAHTVWMRSSFPLLHKLRMNHMLPMPRSLLMRHSPPRHRSY